jgi:hypothetical protein
MWSTVTSGTIHCDWWSSAAKKPAAALKVSLA